MYPLNVIAGAEAVVTLTNATIQDIQPNPNDTRCGVVFGADGNIYEEVTTLPTRNQINALTNWIRPTTSRALYEVMATVTGDALEAGSSAINTWLPGGVEYVWSNLVTSSNQDKETTVTLQVRLGAIVKDSGAFFLNPITGTPP